MKIRMGFITNSSSTNFLIISKKELTSDYLYKKLGFKKGSPMENAGRVLCDDIMRAVDNSGLRYFKYETPDYETIKEVFGEKSAELFFKHKNFHVYWGYTSSDENSLTQFFTTDSFEIEERDFYINGRARVW